MARAAPPCPKTALVTLTSAMKIMKPCLSDMYVPKARNKNNGMVSIDSQPCVKYHHSQMKIGGSASGSSRGAAFIIIWLPGFRATLVR